MLLTISTTHQPATDLGYRLHKHPDRFQSYELSFGCGHVFYPEPTTIGYSVRFVPVGPKDDKLGPPTQMGVFTRE